MTRDIPPHLKGALIIDDRTFSARFHVGREAQAEVPRTVHVGGDWSPAHHARKP